MQGLQVLAEGRGLGTLVLTPSLCIEHVFLPAGKADLASDPNRNTRLLYKIENGLDRERAAAYGIFRHLLSAKASCCSSLPTLLLLPC